MANTRISNLTASASNLASTDLAPVVQTVGVGPVKMTGLQLAGGLLGSTTFNGSTVTTSSPVLNLTQTWNAGAVTFTGLRFNAAGSSDANSAAGSLLLDLQVGGASKLTVGKDGATFARARLFSNVEVSAWNTGVTIPTFWANTTSVNSTVGYGFSAGYSAADLILTRAAAATLQLGAADVSVGNAVAQTLCVQSTTAAGQTAPDFTIQGSKGTTAGGKIVFQTAATNTLATAFSIDKNGNLEGGNGPTWSINYATNSRMGLHSAYALCWGVGAGGVSANMSVGLRSEDTTCLGLFSPDYNYNMSFRIYNNSGSKVNFQRLVLSAGATANMAVVAADNGGTGLAMGLQFGAALTTGGGVTSIMNINTSGHLVWNTDNAYDIGAATATRPRNVYAATSIRATGSTAVIGYGTGAGGAVTQATSRTTGVTLNKGCGQITLVSAAGTTSWQSFTVSNTTVAATDTIIVNQDSGTDLYQIFVTNVGTGTFQITFATTGGTTTEQPVFSFAVIKAVTA